MESININTGLKRIAINGDESKVISFNPNDILFAEKFYQLIKDFDAKQVEYQVKAKALNENKEMDENGLPANLDQALGLLKEVCAFMREKIDYVFGVGTSKKAFGDTLDLDLFEQFLNGMMPFIQNARAEKVSKYVRQNPDSSVMK